MSRPKYKNHVSTSAPAKSPRGPRPTHSPPPSLPRAYHDISHLQTLTLKNAKNKPMSTSFGVDTRPAGAAPDRAGAVSFFSDGWWRDVRNSADADLRLLRSRAGELEHLLLSPSPSEPPLVSRLRRAYSSASTSASSGSRLRIDLSAIGKAIVAGADDVALEVNGRSRRRRVTWKGKAEEWEVVRVLKERIRELEEKTSAGMKNSEVFGLNFGRGEFVDKLKLSLVID